MLNNKIKYIHENREHESAKKHVSGLANYTDDILEPDGLLLGAIGWSKKSNAIINKIDLTDVNNSEGVKCVITYEDIPGINDVGPVLPGDPIFPQKKVEYYGQPLFAVAATTTELARKAVLKAKINYNELKPIITIQEALKNKSYITKPKTITNGNPYKKVRDSKNYLEGKFTTGSQEHFYLEGQISISIIQK